ncbi:MAG TPA: amidohydrolase [Solirubrobacteraceae bacterium]|nr:amidohydrolase [Solirubrobacteraceae bacterium]
MTAPDTPSMPVTGMNRIDGLDGPADLVVRNAKIYTGDRGRPAASAVAIRDGAFVAVGDEADIAAHVGAPTRIVDARGRRVIPGLNDSHQHVIRTGLRYLLELRWDGVPSLRIALRMLREQAERTPPGQWVRVVGGWTDEQFVERRIPTIGELNEAAPDTPVVITHAYQAVLLNRAALQAIGYTRDTPDPLGGQFVRNHAGVPTGLLLAAPSPMIIYSTLARTPDPSPEEQLVSTRYLLHELNRFGLTSAMDAAGGFQNFPDNYSSVMQLAEQGELSLRLAYYLFPQTPGQELDDLKRWVETLRAGDGDRWLRCNGVGECLVWATNDFENFAEPRPQLPPNAAEQLDAAARLLVGNGWGFRMHATYDESIRTALDVFERMKADGAWPEDIRWMFDHAETVSSHSLERIKALGGAISVQHRMAYQGSAFARRYGPERAAVSPPIRAMLDQGLRVGAGTDAPRVSSYNPWLSLSWLVTGRTVGGAQLYPPENRVSRELALDMYTTAGADFSGEGDVKGTISVGKYADLAVLSADYLTVPEEDISRIESMLTVVDGRIVYSTGEYDDIAPPLPPIPFDWSPIAHFGAYQQSPPPGVRQAQALTDVVAESNGHRTWREGRGEIDANVVHHGHHGCY